MTTKKKKNQKLNKISLIISITLVLIAFFLKKPLVLRPIIWLIALFILALNIKKTNSLKNSTFIVTILCIIFLSFILDAITVITLKRIPIFAYNIINSENARVYKGIAVRVWQCDKENYDDLIVAPFYKKGYMCDADDLAAMDINSFLNSAVENYDDYKNMYIKIKGKISKKNGQNYLEMRPYETSDITVNGYVNFADNITLRIVFPNNSHELDDYDVYDEITIVGLVKNLEKENEKNYIYMSDSRVVSEINLNEFTITATPEKECTGKNLIYTSDDNKIYLYCLEDIIVNYADDNKYEIATALSSNKLTIDNLKVNPKEILVDDETNNTIYQYDDYSIMFCNPETSEDIIIGNKNMKFDSVTCDIKIEQE